MGELVQKEPNAALFYMLYTTCLFNPFVIFGCVGLSFCGGKKKPNGGLMGELYTSLAMLYQLAVPVEKVGWLVYGAQSLLGALLGMIL